MPTENALSAAGFRLLESLLIEDGEVFLANEHLARLARSAAEFGFDFPEAELLRRLASMAAVHPQGRWKLRLQLSQSGEIECESAELTGAQAGRIVGVAKQPLPDEDPFLRHKTTRRALYDARLAAWPGCDDVILHNQSGLLTESCIANLVLELDGERLTPAASAALLPGTFRQSLLASGEIREAALPLALLREAENIWLINSVRRWMPVAELRWPDTCGGL